MRHDPPTDPAHVLGWAWVIQRGISEEAEIALHGACRRWIPWSAAGRYSDGRLGRRVVRRLRHTPPRGYVIIGPRPPDLPTGLPEHMLRPKDGSWLRAVYTLLDREPSRYHQRLMAAGEA